MLELSSVPVPLIVAFCFYISVFFLAEILRRFVDRYCAVGTLHYNFFVEAIATAQMCTCVYENAIIIRNYGPIGFFLVVSCLLFIGGRVNRGAFVSPLAPIEMFFYKVIDLRRLLSVIAGEFVGGYSAFRIARQLWYWSLNFSHDHAFNYRNLSNCIFVYKVSFIVVPVFEIFACFLMRSILGRLPLHSKHYFTPFVISAFLTLALVIVGVPGLNPTVASSRLQGCEGLSFTWFVVIYWICPTIGWMCSAYLEKLRAAPKAKKAE